MGLSELLRDLTKLGVATRDMAEDLQHLRAAIPFRDYGTADKDTAWDGPAQVAAADVTVLRQICAWYDAENPDIKSSYKLPHHLASNKRAVWRGVAAAMSRLMQPATQIPDSERRGVYRHLARHYAQFDETPPDFK